MSQGYPITYFNEKLNEVKKKYSTYDKKNYAVVQSLIYLRHYLLSQEFILFSDHEALRYIGSQKKLNSRHAKWIEFFHEYTSVLKHNVGTENKAVDASSRKIALLHSMRIEVTEFERLKEAYASCLDFGETYTTLMSDSSVHIHDYILQDDHLFKGARLSIPCTSV